METMAKDRKTASKKNIRILFTCIGRRVSLLNSFRKAAKNLKINATFLGTETSELSPALQHCDRKFIVKRIDHPQYLKQLRYIVKSEKVNLIVPTIDTDLLLLAKNKSRFEDLNCRVLVSDPQVVEICQDKRKTHRFLVKNNFTAADTMSIRAALEKKNLKYPCFLKPWDGYASRGNAIVKNRKELLFFGRRIPNAICQEFIKGIEHTCDVYVDFDMKVRCVVQRKRIEIRAGEVSKAQIVTNSQIVRQAKRLIESLAAGPGVITLQLFLTGKNKITFIEINPRFGGGAPLSIKAGADFPKWILQELSGNKPSINLQSVKDGLVMLRYDSEVWL
jgi:carbamoyl-phosphate synthase large subunit